LEKVKNGTEYFIGLIPFGGLNKIYGMDEIDEENSMICAAMKTRDQ